MPRFSITVPEEIDDWIEVAADDDGPYESKSEAARAFLELAHRIDQLDEDIDDVIEKAGRVPDLERKAERLENEKRALITDRQEHTELVKFAEEQRELTRYQERRQRLIDEAPLTRRLKWKVTGVPVDALADGE